MASKIKPLGDRILVEPLEHEVKTKGGIVLPDSAKEKPQQGKVISVGSGRILDNGQKAPLELKAGDIVIYAKYGGTEYKLGDKEYMILNERDILAVVE
jgi:chaperonin GroES